MIGGLTNHLWQSTLFTVLAGLLTIAFRRNRAQVRYWLWFSASIKFFVPFALLMSLGSHLWWASDARKSAAQIAAPAISETIVQISQPFSDPPSAVLSTGAHRDWLPMTIFGVWACGFAAIAFLRLRSWRSIRAAIRASTPTDIPAAVEVRSSPGLLEPGVVGVWRPILLVPAGIQQRLTPPQLEAVLAHELCHVRRRDNLFASVHMLAEATFWFHPLVWWIGARLLQERERACDEEVLRMGSAPGIYAEGILNICKLYAESPLVCVSGVTGSDLKQRIEAIMNNRAALKLNFARKSALAAAAIVALAAPIAVGVINAPLIRAQSATAARPKFEASSISACSDQPGLKRGYGYSSSPGMLNTGCLPLADEGSLGLIQRAYVRFAGGQSHWPGIVPIEGGPDWIRSELYTIKAKAEGLPNEQIMQGPMLQALLEDRFKLRLHRETREIPVYVLTAAQGGPLLKPFTEGSCTPMPVMASLPKLAAGQEYCKVRVFGARPVVDAQGSTLAEFAQLLDLALDRPVVDRTGIGGKFDIHLEFAIDSATPRYLPGGDLARFADTAAASASPSIFTAMERLGLKLEPVTGPREFLVIDHIERPAGN